MDQIESNTRRDWVSSDMNTPVCAAGCRVQNKDSHKYRTRSRKYRTRCSVCGAYWMVSHGMLWSHWHQIYADGRALWNESAWFPLADPSV